MGENRSVGVFKSNANQNKFIVTTSNTAGVNANAEVIPNTNRPTTANTPIIAKFWINLYKLNFIFFI